MRIFVTGGTGFIGSHFVDLALLSGHEVVCLRRSTDSSPSISLQNNPLWTTAKLEDITPFTLKECSVVVHFASAGVSPKRAKWEDLVNVNVNGTAHLIASAHAAGIRRIVVAGSCHEYGQSASRYQEIPPDASLEPLSLYGGSKAAAFQIASSYARTYDLELFYGRVFSAYGEGQFEKNFWPSLRSAALNGENFLMTSGMQIRDFIPVQSVALKFLEACHRSDISPGFPCVENIGSGNPQTLLSFAQDQWNEFRASGKLAAGALPDRPREIPRLVPLLPKLQ